MYSDNETSIDLLGFEDQVSDMCDIALNPALLPVTVGVLGDWGSGKSSLLRMAEQELQDRGAVVVYFSPWRIEDYDDAKSALLDAVVQEVSVHVPADGLADGVRESLVKKLRGLRRRVRWLRAAGMAAKHIVTVTAPSLDELDQLLREPDGEDDPDHPSTARITRDFHEEFRTVVDDLGLTVVVLVDDLDRCQPEQVLDVLHAIRLFLAVPGTAFVIATDERVVRDAVRLRYPQASVTETDLPRDYLEKIVQFPLRVPTLSRADIESYMNLLVAEKHFSGDELVAIRAEAAKVRSSGLNRTAMNVGIARSVATVPAEAESEFELVARIAGVLGTGLKGNPRQVKRFLNALELRRRLADRRNVLGDLDESVLAKLTVLEYVDQRRFQELHQAQLAAGGRAHSLASLEQAVRPTIDAAPDGDGESEGEGVPNKKVGKAPAKAARAGTGSASISTAEPVEDFGTLGNWATNDLATSWLRINPPLANVDLGPYFLLARDTVYDTSLPARRLDPELQVVLEGLCSEAQVQRDLAVRGALKLDEAKLSNVVDAGIARMGTDANVAVHLGLGLAVLAKDHPRFAAPVLNAFAQLAYGLVPMAVPIAVTRHLHEVARDDVIGLMQIWMDQGTSAGLSTGAGNAMRFIDGD